MIWSSYNLYLVNSGKPKRNIFYKKKKTQTQHTNLLGHNSYTKLYFSVFVYYMNVHEIHVT